MPPDESRSLSAWIAESRTAQGLPPVLADPAAIDRAADVFRIVLRAASPPDARTVRKRRTAA